MIKLPFTFRVLALALLLGVFHPLPGQAASDLRSLKSGVWVGAVRGDDQGNPDSCYLAARKSNNEFWIILKLDDAGLHVLLYNENWKLGKGETFQSRVVIDKHLFGKVKAATPTATGFDFLIGNDEPSMEPIQSGRRISFTTPKGKKTFKLKGTRRAVNVLIDCADNYLTADAEPGSHSYQAGVDAFNKKDYQAAFGHFSSMADAGDAASQNALAILYYNGLGVDKDLATAAQWFQRAADQDLARAQNNLGEMYRDGEGVAQDDARALELFRAAAVNGSDQATKNATAMLVEGRTGEATGPDTSTSNDVTQGTGAGLTEPVLGDVSLAGRWQTSFGETTITWEGDQFKGNYFAENGDADNNGKFRLRMKKGRQLSGIWAESYSSEKCATKRLGTYYWGRLRLDEPVSASGFTIAWGYCADGLLENGWDYVSKREAAPAFVEQQAQALDVDALIERAFAALKGNTTTEQQVAARQDVEAAAALGSRRAQLMLSIMLEGGIGGPADPAKARDYLDQAADGLLPDALYRRAGLTAKTDPEKAMRDIKLAAAQGFVPALQVYTTMQNWESGPVGATDADQSTAKVPKGDLIAIQAMLNSLGYQAGPPLGEMTEETAAAITAFQEKEDLAADGQPSTELRDQLVKVLEEGN